MQQEQIWGEISPQESTETQPEVQLADCEFQGIDHALQYIIDERNKLVTELNQSLDELDEAKVQTDKLMGVVVQQKEELDPLREQLAHVGKLTENHASLLSDYNSLLKKNESLAESLKATIYTNKSLEAQKSTTAKLLKVANKDLKQVKSNLANQKKNNDTLSKRCTRLTKENKELSTKRDYQSEVGQIPQFPCVYKVGYEALYIFPQRHIMNNGDSVVEQTVLLYTDMRGVYLTTCLSDDFEAVFSSPLKPECKLSDRTVETYRKNSISPSDEVRAYASQWLYRVNIEQKMKVERADMITFTGE